MLRIIFIATYTSNIFIAVLGITDISTLKIDKSDSGIDIKLWYRFGFNVGD